ncbi:Type I secretion system membrane fusion protein PrsE [Methyloligella halotolerans]|uniref:Membrane fusion protein (MFP) family protein n=1 Tax=Methyloligella halotolerans TaxID=1177755 RepID=A0A1E2RWX3_9HYPH|nr:HlyD family type I secretion periplasmic adaptor subunit [Methyloligella halotolerans]ODA66713.1 Type I secretion system membrane fusion protein PrsE [Methyloligella halotolerans]
MTPKRNDRTKASLRRHILLGTACALILVGGLGAWAALTEISGAVIAHGVLEVDSKVKKVQHPTGGVVGELLVREGDSVEAGQILVKLDETQTKANLAIVSKSIDELLAREARLEAEKTDADALDFSDSLTERQDIPNVQKLMEGERKLFQLRLSAREGRKAQLRERIAQLDEEISGLTEQAAAKKREIGLLEKELGAVRSLWEKKLVQLNRVTEVERDAARLAGERGQLIASIAQAKGKIAEVKLQIIQVDDEMRSEVAQQLAEIRASLSELTERKVTAEDQLRRIDIRAPQDGIVHELQVNTVGGVIAAGEQIMLIVPRNDDLIVEAHVSPNDIDQLQPGQKAVLHFSGLNQRTTPELDGEISRIGADLSTDKTTGKTYFLTRVAIEPDELAKLGGVKLMPGMPVEVFMQTAPRTVLSFMLKPLQDQIERTFREA